MKTKCIWILFVLCLALMSVGLFGLTPLMAPVESCSPAEFWWAACRVDILEGGTGDGFGSGTYPPRDGYFICYEQGFHGQFLMRVEDQAALAEFPKVVAKLDQQLREQGPTTPVLEGYESWLAEDASRSDAHLLLRKARESQDLYWRKNRISSYRFRMEEGKAFDRRWESVQRYWLNVLFEFLYVGGLITFAFWPWLRRQASWRKCAHVALLPLLLMLPYYLGYATFTYTSAGPSGGVLYPFLIAGLRGGPCLWPWLVMVLPKPLEHVSQPLGPMLSLSGGGGPGVVVCLLAGAAAGLAIFSLSSIVRHRRQNEGGSGNRVEGRLATDGEGQPGATPSLACRRGALKIALTVLAAFLVVLGLALAGMLTRTPFMWAAGRGDLRSLRFALKLRPGLVRVRDSDGHAALHFAADGCEDEVASLLLERGADPNVQAGDGTTPLHLAADGRSTRMLQILLSAGADVNMRDGYGETPLHQARTGEAATLLLEHGADTSAATPDGRTPLHYAACGSAPALVEVLVANGASLESPDRWGQTPLHLGAAEGTPDVAERLLALGADPNARTTDGRTPLHVAVEQRGKEMVELLLESGADVNAVTSSGLTPLDLAREERQQEVRDLLLKYAAEGGKETGTLGR